VRPTEPATAAGWGGVSVPLRLEARRAAAWLTLVVATGATLGCRGGAVVPLAIAVGGLLAVAAIGHLPTHLGVGPATPRWSLAAVRIQGPMLGAILAGAVLAVRGGPAAATPAALVAGSLAATAALVTAFLRRDVAEAVAVGHSLTCVGLGAAAGVAAGVAGGGGLSQFVASVAVSAALAGGLLTGQPLERLPAPGSSSPRHRRPFAGAGPAMVSALVAMAGCYFLAPQFAWGYGVIAVGWFVVLAVPAATAARGSAVAERLVRSSPGRPAAPGTLARAVPLVATIAALLAWPAVVAAMLAGPEAGSFGGPLAAVLALGLGSCLTLAAVAAGSWCGNEVARALSLAVFGAAATAAARWAANLPAAPGFPPFSPVSGP